MKFKVPNLGMMNISNWKVAACTGGSIFLGGVAFKLYSRSVTKNRTQNDVPINEVLIYGGSDEAQSRQIGLNNLFCVYYVIVHANCSIEVCVPTLESETIAKCLVGARQKKVNVRVVVHSVSELSGNLEKLSRHGIEVKMIRSQLPLEHEFILVDAAAEAGEAVAVLGAVDYETSRVNCHRDATLLTSETAVVKTLKREFERVWNLTHDAYGNDKESITN